VSERVTYHNTPNSSNWDIVDPRRGIIARASMLEDAQRICAAMNSSAQPNSSPSHHGMRRVRLDHDEDLEACLHPEFGMTAEGRVMVEFDDGQCLLFDVSSVSFLDPYAPATVEPADAT